MAEATIDSLKLEISSSSNEATKGLDALSRSLKKIQTATSKGLGLGAIITEIKQVNSSVKSSSLDGLNRAIDTLSKLNGIKLSSSIGNQITAISTAFKGADFSSGATKIQELVTALEPLKTLGKTNLTSTVNALNKLPEALNKIDTRTLYTKIQSLTRIFKPLADEMQKIANGFSAMPAKIQKLIASTEKASVSNKNLTHSNDKVSTSYVNLYAKLKMAASAIKTIANKVAGWIKLSSDYTETMNLFTVSMGQYAKEAYDYAQTVGDVMGIDPAEWMKNQGVFMTLTKGFGVVGDRANTMSQQLTQLGYDLSSFFNISVEDAMTKLQSGISGELEPLRRLGYDLSQAKLEATALSLGIDKAVSSMTQAEKAELRYYAIMTQVTDAHGDMARTLDAPANQMRILNAQVTQLGRALGNFFVPLLNKTLPYIIASVKVLREVLDVFMDLLGIELANVDFGKGSITSATGDVVDNLEDGQKEAKKLKSYMLGFDELNVLNADEGSDDLEDLLGQGFDFELPTYDFMDGVVGTQVNEIVDKMKEWLGITGEIDSWSDLFDTKLGEILEAVGLIGGGFALWKLSSGFTGAIQGITSLFGIGGGTSGGKSSKGGALKGVANLAIIIVGLTAVVSAIGLLTQIPGFDTVVQSGLTTLGTLFTGLVDIAIPIVAVSAAMILMGKVKVSQVAKGLADMAIIIGGTTVLITAIGAIMSIPCFSDFASTGVTSVQNVFNGLWDVATPIGALSALVVGLGFATPATVLSGLAGFALIIGGVELILVALGALKQIPGFTWIVDEGGQVLVQLGNILGNFAGSIIGGFGEGASESFPKIGENLAGFMEKATPFFEGLENIDNKTFDAAGTLCEIVLSLTASNVLNGLTSWFTGGNSMVSFGEDLSAFAPHLVSYANTVKDLDGQSIEASANAAMILAEFAKNVPNEGGMVSWFTGENNIDTFGEKLSSFGENMMKYAKAVDGLDASVVENSAIAAKAIISIAKDVPNEGGVAAWFAGENNIDTFSEKLPSFGENMMKYAKAVDGLDASVVENSANAAKAIAEVAKNLPNSGGVASWFAGENDIDTFGEKLPSFGENIMKYAGYVKGIDATTVANSANAAKTLSELATNLPNSGGIVSWFTGDNGIDAFGKKIAAFGEKFKEYYDTIKTMSTTTLTNINKCIGDIVDFAVRIKDDVDKTKIDNFTTAIKNLGTAIKNLPTSKTISLTIKQVTTGSDGEPVTDLTSIMPLFAQGGFPETGQMFIAREAGAELVGNIGGRTAVVNNDQIVESVSAGVYQAMVAALDNGKDDDGNTNIVINLDGETIYKNQQKIARGRGYNLGMGAFSFG